MVKNLFVSAICAGIVAGLIAALLQFIFVIPVLLEGELFETGARLHFGNDGSPQSDRGVPGLGDDWGRHSMTVAFNIITYTGYGLILAAMISYAALKGSIIPSRQGVIWGLCGFIAVQLAPAIGLPPELPGTLAAEIGPRQMWWLGSPTTTVREHRGVQSQMYEVYRHRALREGLHRQDEGGAREMEVGQSQRRQR